MRKVEVYSQFSHVTPMSNHHQEKSKRKKRVKRRRMSSENDDYTSAEREERRPPKMRPKTADAKLVPRPQTELSKVHRL